MSETDLETLPLAQRLALSYAPARSREAFLTLFLLDNRLAAVLRQRGEDAIIAQMKLAWWRDRFGQGAGEWPKGEPLLARLQAWPVPPGSLVPLVDGWEALLAEQLDEVMITAFVQGRAGSWRELARALCGGDEAVATRAAAAGRAWAHADLAVHLGEGEEAKLARRMASEADWSKPELPRALRPMAVLQGLARRAVKRGSDDLLDGPGAMLTALQLGIFGR